MQEAEEIHNNRKNHRECARDKPADRTATCRCKVLKLERWDQILRSSLSFATGFLNLTANMDKEG